MNSKIAPNKFFELFCILMPLTMALCINGTTKMDLNDKRQAGWNNQWLKDNDAVIFVFSATKNLQTGARVLLDYSA